MTDSTFTTSDGREVTAEDQLRMAAKIGKLIAMSEDDSLTPEARATYAEKAETLMREYRINEENVISTGESQVVPIAFEIVLVEGMHRHYSSEFQDAYQRIWREISKHAGLKSHCVYRYDADNNDARNVAAVGFGYEMDVRLAQFLWTSAHLTFATRIEARVDRKLSDQLNCYYMRGSGQERNDIAEALWGAARDDGKAHGKVQKLYLAECAARGEEPLVGGRGFIARRYREAFANGFVDQFGWRLRDARSAVDAKSGGLVLHGRIERVEQAYWEAYPDRAPKTAEEQAEAERRNAAYWEAQAKAEAECAASGKCRDAMRRAERKAEDRGFALNHHEVERAKCKDHRPYEATASDRARWNKEAHSPEKAAGRRAGAAAASSVEFRRTGGERTQKAPSAERTALGG